MDFILATNRPGQVRDWLIARELGTMETDAISGDVFFKPAHDGLRIARVSNPIRGNTLSLFLFRFAREMETQDDDGDVGVDDRFTRSKLVKWVKNNGTKVSVGLKDNQVFVPNSDAPGDGTWVDDPDKEETFVDAWRVTSGQFQVYLIKDISKICVWQ